MTGQGDEEKGEMKVKIRRRLFTEKYCPVCLGKLRVFGSLSGWATPAQYICDKCGYVGYVSLEKAE